MTDTGIQVIRAGCEDISDIKSLFREIEAESHPDRPEAGQSAEAGLDRSLAQFDFLRSDSFWFLLARLDGAAAGYATLVRTPKADQRIATLNFDELHVLEAYRRRGVASAIMREAQAIAEEIGAWRIRLGVSPDNLPGRELYAHLGFSERELVFCEKSL